jgi:hypothetical protein
MQFTPENLHFASTCCICKCNQNVQNISRENSLANEVAKLISVKIQAATQKKFLKRVYIICCYGCNLKRDDCR